MLERLICNPGLVHVAHHIVSFMDDKTVAQCRRVSKFHHDFLMDTFQKRKDTLHETKSKLLREAQSQCEIKVKFVTNAFGAMDNTVIEGSIFDFWPEWKVVLTEIKKLQDLSDVVYFLRQYITEVKPHEMMEDEEVLPLLTPLQFMVEHQFYYFKEKSQVARFFGALMETSLDFNEWDEDFNTPLLKACSDGSKDIVEFLLDNAVKKGIHVTSSNRDGDTIVHCALHNDEILEHLFDRRKEFGFDIKKHYESGDNIFYDIFKEGENYKTFEIMLRWAMEQGISVSHVNNVNENMLHRGLIWGPDIILLFLQKCDMYGLKETVASMANVARQNGQKPIDMVKEGISLKMMDEKLGNQLIAELEKYTDVAP